MKNQLLVLGSFLLSGCTVIGIRNAEEADHSVLYAEGNIQIRQYETLLIAQTEVTGDYEESGKIGFKRLAGYIFGDNTSSQKIDMTIPVVEENQSQEIAMTIPVYQQAETDKWTMTFVLPSQYTLETIPKPLDETVEIKQLPPKKVATIRYTGFIRAEKIEAKAIELKNWLDNHHYKSVGDPYSAAYDPPWTIPFLRRNEVHIEIK